MPQTATSSDVAMERQNPKLLLPNEIGAARGGALHCLSGSRAQDPARRAAHKHRERSLYETMKRLLVLIAVLPLVAAPAWAERPGPNLTDLTIEELMNVKGIGEKTFDRLRPHLVVEGETTLKGAPEKTKK